MIDLENAYTGSLYYLYEYPIFIQDVDFFFESYEQIAILRPHFVQALRHSFPKGSADAVPARDVMREKNYLLNSFPKLIGQLNSDTPAELKRHFLRVFVQRWRDGTGLAYDGRQDYVPDPELESDED